MNRAILLGVLSVAAVCSLASAQGATAVAGGTWDVLMYAPRGEIKEQWTIQQARDNKITGTVKRPSGQLPLTGTLTGKVIRGHVVDGSARLTLFVTIEGDSLDGTLIAKDGAMLLVRAKRLKPASK
jgi:hypothetical protein